MIASPQRQRSFSWTWICRSTRAGTSSYSSRHLAAAEPAEVVAAALRADLLVLADLVLDLAGDELALLLGVLAPRPQRGDPVGLGASGVADRLGDGRHLLGARAEDVALQLLEA